MVALLVSMIACNLMAKRAQKESQGSGEQESLFAVVKKAFPMFILWSVVMAGLNTFGVFNFNIGSTKTASLSGKIAKFLFASALAGAGFKIKFKDVFSKGIKPIALGGITWVCVAASSMIFIHLFYGYVGL